MAGIGRQTLQNYEVLIIDDGSTDGTIAICDEYAKKDNRIKVFHEPHKGVAHARQVGIEKARGEYSIHIDADDKIESTMLEEMYHAAKGADADILICDYLEKKKDGIIYRLQKPSALTKEIVVVDLLEGTLYGALWNKLIRTSVFRDNGVGFRQELRMREDMFFIFDVLPYMDRIAYLPKAFYTYDRTNNTASLTNAYLCEDRNYYDQEIRWHEAALSSSMIVEEQKRRLRESLLNYAYITLSGYIFDKEEWMAVFAPLRVELSKTSSSYKKLLVQQAMKGLYTPASIARRLLVLIKSTK